VSFLQERARVLVVLRLCEHGRMGPTLVFRSTYGRVLTVATAAAAVVATAVGLGTGGLAEAVRTLVPAALLTYLVWLAFWRPSVTVSDGGIDVANVTRDVHVPWPAYEGVGTQYSLDVRWTGGHVVAWAAPRSSGVGRRLRRPRRGADRELVTGASAEAVAAAVTERHAALVAAGHLGPTTSATPTARTTWRVTEGVVLALGAAATVAVLAV
jgi:hypothetical protein